MTTKRTCLLIFSALLAFPLAAAAADKAGDVVYLRGSALIERKTAKVPAALKAELRESDNVVTRKRARIKMLFRDDSVLTLGENSRLIIKKYLYSPENKRAESIYELADGKLRAVVGNAGFKVTTPTAFAAARGTVFITWFDSATNSTGVAVIEGSVSVANTDPAVPGVQILNAGQMTFVPAHQPPLPTQVFNPQAESGIPVTAGESDVNASGTPKAVTPPPGPPVHDLNAVVQIIPTTPPLQQIPRGPVTPVSVNLTFQ